LVRLADDCSLHRDGACHRVAVHEFAVATTPCIYAHCDPDGPVPETTTDIVGVRFLWADGRAETIEPAQTPYLHPIAYLASERAGGLDLPGGRGGRGRGRHPAIMSPARRGPEWEADPETAPSDSFGSGFQPGGA